MDNDSILQVAGNEEFSKKAISTFKFQAKNNPVYSKYLNLLSVEPENVKSVSNIPFLPIEFFKSYKVYGADEPEELCFLSSGTSGMQASSHYVASKELYIRSFTSAFEQFYGDPGDYCFLALLPSYLERGNSSLVFMVNHLIQNSRFTESGFYLDELDKLSETISKLERNEVNTILLGVSYALLDLAESYPMALKHTIVMETGGMKGRREELSREELHSSLGHAFKQDYIHSEYGMTELLSQAYSRGKGLFIPPPWMRVFIRDPYDPFSYLKDGRAGGINIIDLANKYSCSFIETQDLGRAHPDQSFEVLGRFDNSDIRGCNLLVQ